MEKPSELAIYVRLCQNVTILYGLELQSWALGYNSMSIRDLLNIS